MLTGLSEIVYVLLAQCVPYLKTVLEAVGGSFVSILSMFLSTLTEEECVLMQEQVSLHGLEAGQLFHSGRTLLMTNPHTEGALHKHAAQIAEIPLQHTTC